MLHPMLQAVSVSPKLYSIAHKSMWATHIIVHVQSESWGRLGGEVTDCYPMFTTLLLTWVCLCILILLALDLLCFCYLCESTMFEDCPAYACEVRLTIGLVFNLVFKMGTHTTHRPQSQKVGVVDIAISWFPRYREFLENRGIYKYLSRLEKSQEFG